MHWDGRAWRLVGVPAAARWLVDVAAVSAHEVHAVGTGGAVRWDGVQWRVVSLPTDYEEVVSVDARSGALYAVGAGPRVAHVLPATTSSLLHWNGSSWRPVVLGEGDYTSVAISGHDDVWIGGAGDDAFVSHWDGKRLTTSALPAQPGDALDAWVEVTALPTGEAWAAERLDRWEKRDALLYQRIGGKWRLTLRRADTDAGGIAARSPSDVWLVGSQIAYPRRNARDSLIMRWDGRRWHSVPAPKAELLGVATVSEAEAWAVGGTIGGTFSDRPAILHYACSA